mmetsp:Transcript_17131/g.47174  ORF Transcript_17131/g.47174 Transcript_17131/m.47174 type:complete len:209 (+) Transcript_17131:27-653(+)
MGVKCRSWTATCGMAHCRQAEAGHPAAAAGSCHVQQAPLACICAAPVLLPHLPRALKANVAIEGLARVWPEEAEALLQHPREQGHQGKREQDAQAAATAVQDPRLLRELRELAGPSAHVLVGRHSLVLAPAVADPRHRGRVVMSAAAVRATEAFTRRRLRSGRHDCPWKAIGRVGLGLRCRPWVVHGQCWPCAAEDQAMQEGRSGQMA